MWEEQKVKIRDKLIENGVNNLISFWYTNVTKDNILTDEVYKEFFLEMINSNLGNNKLVDEVLISLKKEIS